MVQFKRISQIDIPLSKCIKNRQNRYCVCTAGNVHFEPLIEFQFMHGPQDKVMGQMNLVLEDLNYINDGGSFTLTTGVLNRDPIRLSAGTATAIDGLVIGPPIEIPRGLRISAINPGLLEASEENYLRPFVR